MLPLQDTQVEHNTDRLRYAAMDLLTKLSRQFRQRRTGIIFLIINFTHIVQVPHSLVCYPTLHDGILSARY